MSSKSMKTYYYDEDEFAIVLKIGYDSVFDQALKSCWGHKYVNNCFRYTLDDVKTKIIPGKYGFVAQLNPKRAILRRKPECVSDVLMRFDPEKFHFGKVDPNEILFQLSPKHWDLDPPYRPTHLQSTVDQETVSNEDYETATANYKKQYSTRHVLIINVSPLENCHSLLVPYIDRCYPQILEGRCLRLAIEIMMLSHNPDLKVGMNSLGAYASVNHQHFHVYYLKEPLYLQHCPVKHLGFTCKQIPDCYEIVDYPAEGFAFQLLRKEDAKFIAESVWEVIELFHSKKIAYNIFMTRGKSFTDSSLEAKNEFNAIRIFVWARKSSFGIKEDMGFNPALCELAGHLPIKEENYFNNVTEESIVHILKDVCHETFIKARKIIIEHMEYKKATEGKYFPVCPIVFLYRSK